MDDQRLRAASRGQAWQAFPPGLFEKVATVSAGDQRREGFPDVARDIDCCEPETEFSICTVVNDRAKYREMVASFLAAGFDAGSEYFYVDNSRGESKSAYAAINQFLCHTRSRFVIICHQDVRLTHDDRQILEARLADLSRLDHRWSVAGNAGGKDGELHLRISDPHGFDRRKGELPQSVTALDENFLVVRRASNIGVSLDLDGFHQYGADICIHAHLMGSTCYAIDFHLTHLSAGTAGDKFATACEAIQSKYNRLFQGWRVTHTCADYLVGTERNGTPSLVRRIWERVAAMIYRGLPTAGGRSPSRG